MSPILRSILLAVAGIAACIGPARQGNAGDEEGVLVVGRISDDPQRHYGQLQAMLDYVVPHLASVGIREGRALMARDAQQMASYLRRGRVDWVTETSGTALSLAERSGAEILVATERDGVAQYRSVIFVRKDSGIDSLADLRGHSIALQHVNSSSAFIAPAAAILDAGLRMELLLSPTDQPAADSVGYVLARSESNVAVWVHRGLAGAGAFSNLDWGNPRTVPVALRGDLRIIHRTPMFPRGVELVRPDLPSDLKEALRQVLLQAGDDPQAREPLMRFFGTSRFLPIDAPTAEALEQLRKGVRKVRTRME